MTITSVVALLQVLKNASENIAALGQLDRGQGENMLFGYSDGNSAHFDTILAMLVQGGIYEADFAEDLAKQDALGNGSTCITPCTISLRRMKTIRLPNSPHTGVSVPVSTGGYGLVHGNRSGAASICLQRGDGGELWDCMGAGPYGSGRHRFFRSQLHRMGS